MRSIAVVMVMVAMARAQPAAEVTGKTVAVPAVPDFVLNEEPGVRHVRELLLRKASALGTKVSVKGYVTWIYDCVAIETKPGVTRAQAQKLVDRDPSRCERHKFYLGDTKTTPLDDALWIVDVPRPPWLVEKQRMSDAELAAWPQVPKVKVGDHVVVTGMFDVKSPHGESHHPGLVIYEDLTPAPKDGPTKAIRPVSPPVVAAPTVKPIPIEAVNDALMERYKVLVAKCTESLAKARYDDAIRRCKAATLNWPTGFRAQYLLGEAYHRTKDYWKAKTAFERAVALAPKQAMSWMMLGVARFTEIEEAARARTGRSMSTCRPPTCSPH